MALKQNALSKKKNSKYSKIKIIFVHNTHKRTKIAENDFIIRGWEVGRVWCEVSGRNATIGALSEPEPKLEWGDLDERTVTGDVGSCSTRSHNQRWKWENKDGKLDLNPNKHGRPV